MKLILIVEIRADFLAVLQPVYEADTAVCEQQVRLAMIAMEKAQA